MLAITWLGHSTFELRFDNGEVLVTDPWIEGNPAHPEGHEVKRVDAMIISHGHFDHFHDVLPLARKFKPKIAAIFEITKWLEGKGVENMTAMNKGGTVQLGSCKVTMTHAIHSSCIVDESKLEVAGEPAGFVIHLPDGRRAYFAGDTNAFSDMQLIRELYSPEIAFLPIGDLFTMGPKEAALACKLIQPKIVVPMHFGTFPALTGTPEQLEEALGSDSGIQVVKMKPGDSRTI